MNMFEHVVRLDYEKTNYQLPCRKDYMFMCSKQTSLVLFAVSVGVLLVRVKELLKSKWLLVDFGYCKRNKVEHRSVS